LLVAGLGILAWHPVLLAIAIPVGGVLVITWRSRTVANEALVPVRDNRIQPQKRPMQR
jgi:hypothetical protein